MKVIITKNYEEMSKVAANILAEQIKNNPESVLGLATGSTPIGLYKHLIELNKSKNISFRKIKTVNLDEYVGLEPTHDQSYRYFMNTNLFDHVDIDKSCTNVPSGIAKDFDAECERYENVIKDLGGIDIQLLGIGNNGHIGFNEPCEYFAKLTHITGLTKSTIEANARFFNSESDVPTKAISMGIKTIFGARKILLVASGESKAQTIFDTVCGEITPKVPASILQLHGDVTIVCDEAAAKLLK
ncbi:MAG: glucosamine-6-phosphate deaminase [Oscillospiraceae bacterium]